jgi:hypothetical protein
VENDGSHLTKLNTICSNCCVASDINVRKLFSLQTRKVNCVGVKVVFLVEISSFWQKVAFNVSLSYDLFG